MARFTEHTTKNIIHSTNNNHHHKNNSSNDTNSGTNNITNEITKTVIRRIKKMGPESPKLLKILPPPQIPHDTKPEAGG